MAMDGTRWVIGVCGAIASVALHAVLIGAVLSSEAGRFVRRPKLEGLGANQVAAENDATATLILIEDLGPDSDENFLEPTASAGAVLQNLRLTIITPQPSIGSALERIDTDENAPPSQDDSGGDREARAALFGRYIGQLQARVERAWLRPRSPIDSESFDCRVQILQSARGDIQEVTLQECNGDARWQLSLVGAIERASPLPAPPDPSVFAESLQLSFSSRGYLPGADEEQDEFESMRDAG